MTADLSTSPLGILAGQVGLERSEALESFLARTGLYNEIRNVGSFRRVLGLSGNELPAPEQITSSARTLGISEDDLRRCWLWNAHIEGRRGWKNWFGAYLPEKIVRTSRRRFAPSVTTLGYNPAFWMLRPASFCPLTFERLLDACPECGQELTWTKAHELDECPNPSCRTDFRRLVPEMLSREHRETYAAAFRLIHPVEAIRRKAVRALPAPFCGLESGEVFTTLVGLAGAVRGLERAKSGDEKPFKDARRYEAPQASDIARAYDIVVGWKDSLTDLIVEFQKTVGSPQYRGGLHDLVKYLKSYTATDRLRDVVEQALPRAIRASNAALYARGDSPILSKAREGLISISQTRERFHIDNRTLQRLVPGGACFHSQSEARAGPVLFEVMELEASILAYRGSKTLDRAGQVLGVPSYIVPSLAERGFLETQNDSDACLLAGTNRLVTEASVTELRKKLAGSRGRGGNELIALQKLMTWIADPQDWVKLVAAIAEKDLKAKVVQDGHPSPFERLGLPFREFSAWRKDRSESAEKPRATTEAATKTDASMILGCNQNAVRVALANGALDLSEHDSGLLTVRSLVRLTKSWVSSSTVASLCHDRGPKAWYNTFAEADIDRLELGEPGRDPFLTLFNRAQVTAFYERCWPRACPLRLL